MLLNVFAHELQVQGQLIPQAADIFAAVSGVHRRCLGGYAAIALLVNYGIVGFRDPWGIRPLVLGRRETETGIDYMLASESVALDVLWFELIDDVAPGEAVYINPNGELFRQQCADNPRLTPCIFEHVYFARPDSMMDGISVYKTRMIQGEALAKKIRAIKPDHGIDVVIPIPDTSRIAAQSMAHELGLKFREGFMKNRYIGRTFIMPGQNERKKSVRQKLNPVPLEFEGKTVLLVDDSIVRGTTCRQIIQMARDAGARQVYFASACPPVRYPNVYGIDMPSAMELIAHDRTEDEICEAIGADWLVFQDIEDLIQCSLEGNSQVDGFDCSVFNKEYVTGDIDDDYLMSVHNARNDTAQSQRRAAENAGRSVIGIHNDDL